MTIVAAARPTALGWVAAAWADGRLRRVTIGGASREEALLSLDLAPPFAGEDDTLTPEQMSLLERLQAAAGGEEADFSDVPLNLPPMRPFARRVVQRCRRIRRGQTMTYAALAAACGSPGAARAVGNVMAANRFPLIIPCHRVVGSRGSLGGFSAPTGVELKRRLLELEGALPPRSARLTGETPVPLTGEKSKQKRSLHVSKRIGRGGRRGARRLVLQSDAPR